MKWRSVTAECIGSRPVSDSLGDSFTARFFLCQMPMGQEPRLFTEETSEGFWIFPVPRP